MGRKNKRKKIKTSHWSRSQRAQRMWRDFYQSQENLPPADYSGISTEFNMSSRSNYPVCRGDIFFADLGYHRGTSIQEGCRPVLVISNDRGNYHSNTINDIPLTGCFKRPDLPCHMILKPEQIANRHRSFSVATVLTEQITTISKSALRSYVGRVEDKDVLSDIEHTLSAHLGMSDDNNDHATDEQNNTEVNHV